MAEKKFWDPWKMFDVTPQEMRAIKERAKMTQDLKAKWQKDSTNPYRMKTLGSGTMFDPAVQRFISLKATETARFRGDFRAFATSMLVLVLPVTVLTYITLKERSEREQKYRNYEIKYRDRQDKFL